MDPSDLGAASSTVTFFRSLGGAVGVSALGAVLGNRITHYVKDGLADLGAQGAALGRAGTGEGGIPDLDALPAPIRTVMESAYGHGVADVFLYAAPLALLALLVSLFIKEVPLKTKGALAQAAGTDATVEARRRGGRRGPRRAEGRCRAGPWRTDRGRRRHRARGQRSGSPPSPRRSVPGEASGPSAPASPCTASSAAPRARPCRRPPSR